MTFDQRVKAISEFGFTTRQARFLVTVMLHGGICVPRQYARFAGTAYGHKVNLFFDTLVSTRYAVRCRCVHNRAAVYHVLHQPLYRAIGEPHHRNRKPVPASRVIERLMLLDAVISHPEIEWLATAADKIGFFTAAGSLEPNRWPHLTVGGRRRYFPDHLPIGVSPVGQIVLVFLAASSLTDDLKAFLQRHAELFRALPMWTVRLVLPPYVAPVKSSIEGVVHDELAKVQSPAVCWIFNAARSLQLPGGIDVGLLELSINGRALIAAVACAVEATFGVAILAGAVGFSGNLLDALRSRSGVTPPVRRRATRSALVITQAAVAVTLVAGTGLFARSLMTALGLNTGLDAGRIVTGTLSLGPYGYDAARAATFFDDLSARLRANPAIRSMTYSAEQGGMTSLGHVLIDGARRQFPSTVWSVSVDDAYFATMGIPLVGGRSFSADDRATATPVAIVSESFARQLAGGETVIGRRIAINPSQPNNVREVVGVVKDVVTNVTVLEPLVMYSPLAQARGTNSRSITARAATDPDLTRIEITAAIRALDRAITPAPFLTLEERILQQMAPQYFGALVLGSLGFIAVLLTLLGTYVVAESMAVARTREMGIRAALGARGGELVRIVLGESARLVAIGLAIGLGLVWAGANTIRAFLFGVQPLDVATLSATAALILLLAVIMSLRPAMRAARVDLGTILRGD